MKNEIIILYPNGFPLGGAATNRVFHIAKIIQEGGMNVIILITRGTEKKGEIINKEKKGVYEDIHFLYVNKSVIWPRKIISKIFNLLIGNLKTILFIYTNRKKISNIITYANYSIIDNFFYFFICKFLKIKIIYCIDEYPWSVIYGTDNIFDKFYINYFYKLFDAFIIMTNKLIIYYSNKTKKNVPIFHLPMTVDIKRFDFKANLFNKNEYIAYCGGDKTGDKEGVDILVKAFNMICHNFPNIKLYLIGIIHNSIYSLVDELQLKDKIEILGFIKYEQISEYLMNAKILCSARTDIIQNRANFPTKLGEFLSTGVPVITTNVGEVSNYLIDGINSFIVPPNDINSFAMKMNFVLQNPEIANEVGLRGKELAFKEFNYKNYIHKLKIFINTI